MPPLETLAGRDKKSTTAKNEIDLILSDWNMPKMSGMQLLKEVREDELLTVVRELLG